MAVKCKKCGVPIKGMRAKIMCLLGVRASKKKPGLCNKCE